MLILNFLSGLSQTGAGSDARLDLLAKEQPSGYSLGYLPQEFISNFLPLLYSAPIIAASPPTKGLVASGRYRRAGSGSSGVFSYRERTSGAVPTRLFAHQLVRKVFNFSG